MATIKRLRSFRVNPIEVVIFSTVAAVFAHSVYRLFSESDSLELTALTKTVESASRAPASVLDGSGEQPALQAQQLLSLVNIGCQAEFSQTSASFKVRIQGTICTDLRKPASSDPVKAGEIPHKLTNVTVKNLTSTFGATVFIDPLTQVFVTDYITLQEGVNELKIQRTFDDGKIVEQKVTLQK